jgi:hypothetical protein
MFRHDGKLIHWRYEMVWCGYHPDMGGGIEQFGRGLVSSIEAKARMGGISVAAQIAVEQDQLFLLEQLLRNYAAGETKSETESLRFQALLGLVTVSRYLIGLDATPHNPAKSFLSDVTDKSVVLSSLISKLDSEFEQLPTSETSHCARLRIALKKSGIL